LWPAASWRPRYHSPGEEGTGSVPWSKGQGDLRAGRSAGRRVAGCCPSWACSAFLGFAECAGGFHRGAAWWKSVAAEEAAFAAKENRFAAGEERWR
jgi:hypothetical protein